MTKQVKTSVETVSAQAITPPKAQEQRSLFIKVDTYDPQGKEIGTRIVDMYHFGTRNWLHSHQWWAMHNGHLIETRPAEDGEVQDHFAVQKKLLAEKFNTERQHIVAA